jgi:hypothetical protein
LDCRRAFAALLSLVAGVGVPTCVAVRAADGLPIREMRWTAPAYHVSAIGGTPSACLNPPDDEADAVAIGHAAFRAPLLLGGQAARSGMSCATCHRNGRGNSAFQFPGLSGAAGTADVTSSIMSRKRGDGAFNPVRIPDLVLDTPKISRARSNGDLRHFIDGLITEEFDGAAPPPLILDGLVAYIRALDKNACVDQEEALTLDRHLSDMTVALFGAAAAYKQEDMRSAALLVGSARATLGLIFERYNRANLAPQRRQILAYDARLAKLQSAFTASDARAIARLSGRPIDPQLVLGRLNASRGQSLYDVKTLIRAVYPESAR